MKQIYNWQKATVFDIEGDNLLDDITVMHVLSFQMEGRDSVMSLSPKGSIDRILKMFQWHIDNEVPMIAHNGIGFDVPAIEKLYGVDLSKLMLIDTLAISWYLNTDRPKHGLDSFHEDYGIKKPEITDWVGLSYDEYRHRCEEDVKINKALWEDCKTRLIEMYTLAQAEIDAGRVGGTRMFKGEGIHLDQYVGDSVDNAINRILTFLMYKMDCARLQEKTQWEIDVPLIEESKAKLEESLAQAKVELEKVMPKVPKYAKKNRPAKPFKKNGDLSSSGESWKLVMDQLEANAVDEMGTPLVLRIEGTEDEVKILKGYDEPNSGSTDQIKNFLFSHGWVPQTYKYVKDKAAFQAWIESKPTEGSPRQFWSAWKENKPVERRIPQVTLKGEEGSELCESVLDLAEDIPEIQVYANFGVLRHRIGILNGFLENQRDGKLRAGVAGFTNTLRVKHREVVNLPGVDKPYGDIIRGVLIAGRGKVSCGSDMSSLEDRTKHHFMLPLDPEYVQTMQAENYDPHVTMALTAKMITQEEFDAFIDGVKSDKVKAARKKGKTTNYASVYNAGAAAIARAAGVSVEEGKILHAAYWELNWAVKAIADEQVVIEHNGGKWLVNPINGFCYSLRKDSDRFSTLCQGTGSFFFDMWVDAILEGQTRKWGKKSLTGSFHDEKIIVHKDTPAIREAMEEIIKDAIWQINERYKLRRKLGCETQFGYRYSEIH
jgi:hypothetical protein